MRTNNKLTPHDAESWILTWAKLVGDECPHNYTTPAPQDTVQEQDRRMFGLALLQGLVE